MKHCSNSGVNVKIIKILFITLSHFKEQRFLFSSISDSNDESNGLCESEGTIIYHISHAIKMGHPVPKSPFANFSD